jgi:hypothetical protein
MQANQTAQNKGVLTSEQLSRALELDPISGPEVEAGLQEKEAIIRDHHHVAFIRAGAQTGADRGGLDAARDAGIPICGWVPKGGRAEDMGETPGVLRFYPELKETPSEWYMQRTAWNVRDAHCTLIVAPVGVQPGSGTESTVDFAQDYGRPWLVVKGPEDAERVWEWLVGVGQGLTVNVAGPRASKDADVYSLTYGLVSQILLFDRS